MTLDPVEEARAAAFRAQERTRPARLRARAAALGGDRAAQKALQDTWEPFRAWLADRHATNASRTPGEGPERPHAVGPHRNIDQDGQPCP